MYNTLLRHFGPQGWWPGESKEEIIIGAVLTQNTNWANVEKAIKNLKRAGLLSLRQLSRCKEQRLSALIRPSGYFNIKARRLKAAARFFVSHPFKYWDGLPAGEFRNQLLEVHGVGRETADSILLYAFNQPSFVVDAYTRRFGHRHGFFASKANYEEIRNFFESYLPGAPQIYNEFHALIVKLGKEYCRPRALCDSCPLNKSQFFLAYSKNKQESHHSP